MDVLDELDELDVLELDELDDSSPADDLVVDVSSDPLLLPSDGPVVVSSLGPELLSVVSAADSAVPSLAEALTLTLMPVVRTPVVGSSPVLVESPPEVGRPLLSERLSVSAPQPPAAKTNTNTKLPIRM